MLTASTISVQKFKGQGHTSRAKFLSCPLPGSVPIWPIRFMFCRMITNAVAMCRAIFPGQDIKVKVRRVVRSFCRVRSVAPWLFRQYAWYTTQIQPIRGRCVMGHFQIQRSRSRGWFEVFTVLIWSAGFICGTYTAQEGTMAMRSTAGIGSV